MSDSSAHGSITHAPEPDTGRVLEVSSTEPGFPATILKPGQTYRHTLIYRFSAR
jgi:galactose mutarotase-like enzyme